MLRALAVVVAALATTGPAAVTDLGTFPGGHGGSVTGMSGPLAVGTASSADAFQRAFLHDERGTHALPGFGTYSDSAARAVNGAGHVVGYVSTPNQAESRPVRWIDGATDDLGSLGGPSGGATAVNDHDTVVGWSMTKDGSTTHAFRWSDGRIVDLDAVLPKPAGSTVESAAAVDVDGSIAGTLALTDGQRIGFLWDGSSVREVREQPGASIAVNALRDGLVVGTVFDGSGSRAFAWRNGVVTALPAPLGDGCAAATAIAGNGDIVGWSSLCGRSPTRGVIWRDGIPTDVQALADPDEGLVTRSLFAADERGRVGGFGERPSSGSSPIVVDPVVGRTRVAGDDAVGTSVAGFRRLAPGPRFGVVLAPVDAPADLALAAFLAARRGVPLLLTHGDALDPRVAEALRAPNFASTVTLVGGTAVLSPAVEDGITAIGMRPERVAGADRYGTSDAVAAAAGGASTVFAVEAEDTTTAISAVPLASHRRAVLVLTGPGHPAPAGARQLTAADRESLAAELAPHPFAPTAARFARISDGAVAAVLAARAGSPLRWVDRVDAAMVFVVGGTAVLP